MSALGLGLIAAIAWGFHDICVRRLSQSAPLMACLLMVLAVALLFQLGRVAVSPVPFALNWQATVLSCAAGIAFLVASIGLYFAFQRGPVRLVAPIIASYPVLSVGAAAAQGIPVTALEWAAVLVIAASVGLVAALADESGPDVPAKGPTIFFALIGAVGFAGTFAFGQRATGFADEQSVTALSRIVALSGLLVLLIARQVPLWPGVRALPVLVLMGLADGIALACVLAAGTLENAEYATVAASTFGLLTIVMAWAFLREPMRPLQWVGCIGAFVGIGYLAV